MTLMETIDALRKENFDLLNLQRAVNRDNQPNLYNHYTNSIRLNRDEIEKLLQIYWMSIP